MIDMASSRSRFVAETERLFRPSGATISRMLAETRQSETAEDRRLERSQT
jgi:hypothetical protein